MIIVHALSPVPEPTPWLLALMLGICAAPSSTAADTAAESHQVLAARIGDLDDVLPIALGVMAVAWTRPGTPLAVTGLIAQGGLIALAVAFATWLLMTQTSSESEQRVFAIGALLLLGGAAAHLSLSALFMGLLAGVFWNVTGRRRVIASSATCAICSIRWWCCCWSWPAPGWSSRRSGGVSSSRTSC